MICVKYNMLLYGNANIFNVKNTLKRFKYM